ncbi:hypothetical protein FSP39_021294, partial [Pinctada imbricata]
FLPRMLSMDTENGTTSRMLESEFKANDPAEFTIVIRQFVLPIICFFGLFGNTLSVSTFLRNSMRDNSCSVLLATRSISDNGFLLTLFIVWLDFVNIRIVHLNGVCQLVLFMSYVCSFMSVWCVVFVTIENYIRICHPTKVPILCTTKIAFGSVILGLFLSFLMYNFPIWTAGVRSHDGRSYCMTKERFSNVEHAVTYLDTVFTLIVPLALILFFMAMILVSSMEARRRQSRLQTQRLSVVSELRRPVSPHSKVTRLLFAVTVAFIILHTPSHVIRLKAIIQNIIGANYATSDTDRILQQLFLVLYYLNYSVNIVIYLLCGQNFRNIMCDTYCVRCNSNTDVVSHVDREDSEAKSRKLIPEDDREASTV